MAADNRNFADVLDIQGTEVCLSDKKLAETSSETGVQTTDYVLLQDTDGAYHKILKSNFTEAIRNTLAGLLVNNDKGTSVNQIPAIASGDLGSVTPANLASVLGAAQCTGYADGDLNNYVDLGYHGLIVNKSEKPNITNDVPSFSNWGSLFYFGARAHGNDNSTQGLQVRTDSGSNKMAWRAWTNNHGTITFGSWKEL